MSRLSNHFICFLLYFLIFPVFSYTYEAQNAAVRAPWYEGVFIGGSVLHYFTPEILSDLVLPHTGFRFSLGYELSRFSLFVESGYTRIEGTNPLVTGIKLVPLFIKAGYTQPLIFNFGLHASLGFGFFFSRTTRYKTALDMVFDNLQTDNVRSTAVPLRLHLTWMPGFWRPLEAVNFYAGGGVDIIFETDGPIPLVLAEAGIRLKPGMLARRLAAARRQRDEIESGFEFIRR